MKKFFLVSLLVFFFTVSLLKPVPANASFVDNIKNGLRNFWYEVQLKVPFFPKSAKVILWKMSNETEKAKTVTMKMDLTAKVEGAQAMEIGLTMEAKPLEFQAKDGKDMDATFNANLKTQGVTVTANGQFIQKGETTYFKLKEAPNLGIIDLTKLTGVWYRMPAAQTRLTPTPTLSKDVENKINVLMKKELEGLMGKARKLDDQKIEGEDTYQIQVVLTKADFARIIGEISGTVGSKEIPAEELSKSMESVGDVTVTLNVYKKNWYLAAFGFSTKVQVDNPAVATLRKMDVDMTLAFVLKDYNIPFTVSAPTGAKEFNPMSLYGGFGGVGAPAKDATGSAIPSTTLDLPPGYKLPSGY